MEQDPHQFDPWNAPQRPPRPEPPVQDAAPPLPPNPYIPAEPVEPRYAPGGDLTGGTTAEEIIPYGSVVRTAVAWAAIAVCTVGIAALQYITMNSMELAEGDISPGFNTLYTSRITIGYERVTGVADPTAIAVLDELITESPNPELNQMRVAIVAGEIRDRQAVIDRLASINPAQTDADTANTDAIVDDLSLLERIYGPQGLVPTAAETQQLIDRHGWFGQLAAGYNLPATDPMHAGPRRSAEHAAYAVIGFIILVILALLLGLVLMVMLIVLLASGNARVLMPTGPPGHRTAYLEAVALFLVGFIALQLIAGVIMLFIDIDLTLPLLLLMPIALAWPLVCGVGMKRFRQDMGYIAPTGFFKEIGLGAVGYLAGLPIVAAGIGVSFLVGMALGQSGDHPMGQEIVSGQPYQVVLLIFAAVVWAPLVEESVFRAAFYRHLRKMPGVPGWLVSTFITAFIFAAIHPQGIVGIPVLMSIAFVLAMLREWRQSIVPSMTAHALHNGTVVTFLLLVLYL